MSSIRLCAKNGQWSTAGRSAGRLSLAACAVLLLAGSARADDPWEAWPELNAFVTLGSATRAWLATSYAKSKESTVYTGDATACLDISIKPILRESFAEADWQRSRFFWARIGYTHVFKVEQGERDTSEHRGILSLYGKLPLPAGVWLEARARADLRWIGGDYSTRYRGRLEATRELTVFDHTVVPYLNAEAFYDTRYSGWSRALFQLGTEITVNRHFRVEPYLGRQVEHLPEHTDLNVVGLLLKGYF
jgi:uncharacterized protein DUF2490